MSRNETPRNNFGHSHKELWQIAERVLARGENVTQRDVKIACESGFVTYEIDCDGYLPCATKEFNFWAERFDPANP